MEFIGWIGSVLIVVAYGLNSYQKIRSDSYPFLLMNLAGGLLLIIYSKFKDAPPNIFINAVWVLIAIPALVRLIKKNHPFK